MGEAVQRAAASLRQQAGLPTDVNPVASPSGADTARKDLQEDKPEPSQELQAALAAKDKAIAEQRERIDALEESGRKMAQQLEVVSRQKPEKPLDQLSDEERVQEMARREAERIVGERLSPMQACVDRANKQTAQLQLAEDRRAIATRYPNFDYSAREAELKKVQDTYPGLTALDAVKLVGSPLELSPQAGNVPVVQPSLPSRSSVSAERKQPAPPPQGPTRPEVLQKIAELRVQGNNLQADSLLTALLKNVVPVHSGIRRPSG